VTLKHTAHLGTKACFLTYIKMLQSFCSQEVTDFFTSTSNANFLFRKWCKEIAIAGREIRTVGTSDRNFPATVAVWGTLMSISLDFLIYNNM